MGLLGQPGDQDLVCHLILVQSSFGIYESSCQNAQEAHNLGAINAFWHCTKKVLYQESAVPGECCTERVFN